MPQLVKFWNPAFTDEEPGPLGGLNKFGDLVTPKYGFNGTYQQNAWDTATIRSIQIPGKVAITQIRRGRHIWTIQSPGAPPTPIKAGYEPLEFTMSVDIWTPMQWRLVQPISWDLQPIWKKLPSAAERKRMQKQGTSAENPENAFDVEHPCLAFYNVKACICRGNSFSLKGEIGTLTWVFLEYRRGDNSVGTVDRSQVAAPFDPDAKANQQVNAANGTTTSYTPTQGPQQKPSQAGVTLTPTS